MSNQVVQQAVSTALTALSQSGEHREQAAVAVLAPLRADQLRHLESAAEALASLCRRVLDSKHSRLVDIGEPPVCDHSHTGWVSSMGGDRHMELQVCSRYACQDAAVAWISRATGRRAEFSESHRPEGGWGFYT